MKKGYTLIELMIVIAVVSILLIIIYPVSKNYIDIAKKTTLQNNFNSIYDAIWIGINTYEEPFPIAANSPQDLNINTGKNTLSFNGIIDGITIRNEENFTDLFSVMGSFLPTSTKLAINDVLSSELRQFPFTFDANSSNNTGDFFNISTKYANSSYLNLDDFYHIDALNNEYGIYYINDNDADTYTLAFIYESQTNILKHIVLVNENYICIDGGKMIFIE